MVHPEDAGFMARALVLAKEAAAEGEVPVGAVIVKDGAVIAVGRNRRETEKNALCHAEIEAINAACGALGSWRLLGCTLYVTLEPCPMCAGAVVNARISRLVYGAPDEKAGSVHSVIEMFTYPFNHMPSVTAGVLETECAAVLSDFFHSLRR